MKKLLIGVITILLLVLLGMTTVKGIKIGQFEILGVIDIKNKNEELDQKIQEATRLASTDYKKKNSELDDAIKQLEVKRKEYEEMVIVSTDSEIESANQLYFYDVDMLWTKIGNHAKVEGVTIDIDARNAQELSVGTTTTVTDRKFTCDLYFTAIGSYVGIEEFITHIEDDSELGFKIEDFKMISAEDSDGLDQNQNNKEESIRKNRNLVQATFVCKGISIKGISTSQAMSYEAQTIEDVNNQESQPEIQQIDIQSEKNN